MKELEGGYGFTYRVWRSDPSLSVCYGHVARLREFARDEALRQQARGCDRGALDIQIGRAHYRGWWEVTDE